jgi:hypothetical protein
VVHGVDTNDVKAVTRCKVATGRDASACGIVFRFRDEANHHLARLDFVERRIVVSIVSGGIEREISAAAARVEIGTWQELTVEARGSHLRASCNGRDVVEIDDATSATRGGVGLWVPGAGEAYFDDLAIDDLGPLRALGLLRPAS